MTYRRVEGSLDLLHRAINVEKNFGDGPRMESGEQPMGGQNETGAKV